MAKCKDPEIAQKKSEQVKEIPKEDAYFQIFTGNISLHVFLLQIKIIISIILNDENFKKINFLNIL